MWICVKSIERDLVLVGTADTNEEIRDVMYEDMWKDLEGDLYDAIADGEAEFDEEINTAWSNYRNVNRDWKCFWI